MSKYFNIKTQKQHILCTIIYRPNIYYGPTIINIYYSRTSIKEGEEISYKADKKFIIYYRQSQKRTDLIEYINNYKVFDGLNKPVSKLKKSDFDLLTHKEIIIHKLEYIKNVEIIDSVRDWGEGKPKRNYTSKIDRYCKKRFKIEYHIEKNMNKKHWLFNN